MAATNFSFTDANPIIRRYLNRTERENVDRWQTNEDYTFEFHDGHATGQPIYFRINGNADKKNAPKIDTLNKSASDYHGTKGETKGVVTVIAFANGGKLSGLSAAGQRDIEAIVGTSWASIALLANRYWTQTDAPADAVEEEEDEPFDATPKKCSKAGCKGLVPVYANGSKGMCSKCYTYQ